MISIIRLCKRKKFLHDFEQIAGICGELGKVRVVSQQSAVASERIRYGKEKCQVSRKKLGITESEAEAQLQQTTIADELRKTVFRTAGEYLENWWRFKRYLQLC